MRPTDVVRTVARRLDAAGVDSSAAEAAQLVCAAFGLTGSQLHSADELSDDRAETILASMVERRVTREPLQHILGSAPFRRITVPVGSGVFVPRPETELLVDAVLPTMLAAGPHLAVDLCSGSGALALALVDEVPGARVVALERPGPGADWLLANTARSPVQARIGDVSDRTVLADLAGAADAVVCNPPYVPSAAGVAPEVHFDPDVAVFAGIDGLDVIPAVIASAASLLRSGGILAMEHDDSRSGDVTLLLDRAGDWDGIEARRDLAQRPRYVIATRR